MRSLINPYAGPAQLIVAFEAVVIGAIGSLCLVVDKLTTLLFVHILLAVM